MKREKLLSVGLNHLSSAYDGNQKVMATGLKVSVRFHKKKKKNYNGTKGKVRVITRVESLGAIL